MQDQPGSPYRRPGAFAASASRTLRESVELVLGLALIFGVAAIAHAAIVAYDGDLVVSSAVCLGALAMGIGIFSFFKKREDLALSGGK
ncbi:MAG: hypothetical protein WA001_02365 [Patescibacteria group bacterium]